MIPERGQIEGLHKHLLNGLKNIGECWRDGSCRKHGRSYYIILGAGIWCSLLGSANTACMWCTDILEGKHLLIFYIYICIYMSFKVCILYIYIYTYICNIYNTDKPLKYEIVAILFRGIDWPSEVSSLLASWTPSQFFNILRLVWNAAAQS